MEDSYNNYFLHAFKVILLKPRMTQKRISKVCKIDANYLW